MSDRTVAGFASHVLPCILFSLFIFLISALSNPPAPDFSFEWGDKINHAGAFGIMMLLAFRATGWLLPNRPARVQIAVALLYCILYGATDEIHQGYVPNRHADLFDWVADTVGALLAAVMAMMMLGTRVALTVHFLSTSLPIGGAASNVEAGDDDNRVVCNEIEKCVREFSEECAAHLSVYRLEGGRATPYARQAGVGRP